MGESIIKAYEHLDSLRDPGKFKPWILKITANKAKKMFRKRKRTELTEDMNTCGVTHEDRHDELWEIVLTLDEKYRSVIILYYYEQMKLKEIGEALHLTEGTVKSRMSRAKAKLKEMLA